MEAIGPCCQYFCVVCHYPFIVVAFLSVFNLQDRRAASGTLLEKLSLTPFKLDPTLASIVPKAVAYHHAGEQDF